MKKRKRKIQKRMTVRFCKWKLKIWKRERNWKKKKKKSEERSRRSDWEKE